MRIKGRRLEIEMGEQNLPGKAKGPPIEGVSFFTRNSCRWDRDPIFKPMRQNRQYPALLLVACLMLFFAFGCSKQANKDRYLKRANAYFAASDFKKAEIEFLNLLRLDPTNTVATRRLAWITFDRGQFDRAIPLLLRLRQLDKNDSEVRLKLAQFYIVAGDFPKAREEMAPFLDGAPKNDEALFLLSDTATTAKEIAEAQQRLQALEPNAGARVPWQLAMATLQLRQNNLPAAEPFLQKALALNPQSSHVHVVWGTFRWLQKNLAKAGEEFQRAADLEPIRSPMRLRLVDFRLKTGATNEAQAALRQMTREAPDYLPPWTYLAKIALDQRNLTEASNLVYTVLSQDAANREARLLKAELQRLNGDMEGWIKNLEDLRRVYSRSPQLLHQLSLAYIQNGNRPKAFATLQETLKLDPTHPQATIVLAELQIQQGGFDPAIASLQALIKRQPQASPAYFLLAAAYGGQNRYADALAIYQKLEKANPTNAAAPFYSGIAYRMLNRPLEARQAFEKSLSLSPADPMINYQMVDLDIADKRYEAALQRAQFLQKNSSHLAAAKFLQGRIYAAQTNFTAAENALQQAIASDANFTSAYSLLAQVYLASQRRSQALENLEKLAKRDPKNVASLMLMGAILEQDGNNQKAAEKYQQASKTAPSFAPAANNLAYLLAEKLGKLDEAYAIARRARELAPQEGAIADTLGWIHFRRKEYRLALPLVQEAATKAPIQPEIQFHLGMTYYMMALESLARGSFKRALASPHNFAGRSEAQDRLALLEMGDKSLSAPDLARMEQRVQKTPDDVVALLRLGRHYEEAGAVEKARQMYENARKANPNSAAILIRLAEFYSTLKKPSEALVLARDARKLSPEDPGILRLLCRLTFEAGDHKRATSLLEESARSHESDPELLFLLAQAYFSIGQIDQAQGTAQRASRIGGRFAGEPELKSFLALVAAYKNPEGRLIAEKTAQGVLKTKPDHLPALMVSGLIQQERGNFKQAKETYETIAKNYPSFAPGKKQLAELYSDHLNDQKRAWDYASDARKTMADDVELARTLGKISYRRQDYKNAVRFLQESSRKKTDDSEAFYFLGLSYYQLKQKDESQRALERALLLNPNAPMSNAARSALAELKKA